MALTTAEILALTLGAATPTSESNTMNPPHSAAPQPISHEPATATPASSARALAWCIQHSDTRPTGSNSGRNPWLTRLSYFCNKKGVPQAVLEAHALAHWVEPDFETAEICRTIRGVYARAASEHNTEPFRDYAALPKDPARPFMTVLPASEDTAGLNATETGDTPEEESPFFPAACYPALPDFLQCACQPFEGRERDVLLLSLLTLLSGAFPEVSGTYHDKKTGLNLYSFIAAPAASGKGTMTWAQRIVQVPHRQLQQANQRAWQQYEVELAEYQASKRGNKAAGPPPKEPVTKRLLLPGNASAAALLEALVENEGRGIICETEGDTLTNALNNKEWGDYTTLLRAAFQQEATSSLRKGSGELSLERPALAVLLTGTPRQIQRLLPDVENGLFSRFLFYTFTGVPKWANTFARREPLDPYYEELGQELARMMAAIDQPLAIELTEEQEQRHWAAFATRLAAIPADQTEQISSLFRLGLCAFRLALLLTLLRAFEDGVAPIGKLVCGDQDFDTAMRLTAVLWVHTKQVLRTLSPTGAPASRRNEPVELKPQVSALRAAGMPAAQIAERLDLSRSTVYRWLREAGRPVDEAASLDQAA